MSQKQQGGQSEDATVYVFLFFAIAAAIVFVCWKFAPQVHYALAWIRLRQLVILSHFTDFVSPAVDFIRSTPTEAMTWDTQFALAMYVGQPLRWVTLPCIVVMALVAAFGRRSRALSKDLKEELTLQRLIERQSGVFGWVAPFIKINPAEKGFVEKHPPAMTPLAWARANACLLENGGFEPEQAKLAFSQQLTDPWQGIEALPLHLRALLAAFVLKAARQRSESDEILSRIGMAIALGDFAAGPSAAIGRFSGLVFTIDRILGMSKPPSMSQRLRWRWSSLMTRINPPFAAFLAGHRCNHPLAFDRQAVAAALSDCKTMGARHHYTVTALVGIYQHAKAKGGILQPAYFNWLQYFDRGLWLPLQNQGGRAFHSEAAGAMAHWQAETAFGHPIAIPAVSAAVEGLRENLAASEALS